MLELKLTPKDVLRLVETCARSGVRSLKLQDLELTFGLQGNESTQVSQPPAAIVGAEVKSEVIERESFKAEEESLRKNDIEYMLLNNPSRYEEMVASGELVDEEAED